MLIALCLYFLRCFCRRLSLYFSRHIFFSAASAFISLYAAFFLMPRAVLLPYAICFIAASASPEMLLRQADFRLMIHYAIFFHYFHLIIYFYAMPLYYAIIVIFSFDAIIPHADAIYAFFIFIDDDFADFAAFFAISPAASAYAMPPPLPLMPPITLLRCLIFFSDALPLRRAAFALFSFHADAAFHFRHLFRRLLCLFYAFAFRRFMMRVTLTDAAACRLLLP